MPNATPYAPFTLRQPNRTTSVKVRLNPAKRTILETLAAARRMTVSDYMRYLAEQAYLRTKAHKTQ